MKLFKFFGAIALAALAMPAHAQFTGGSSVGGGSTADITAYNRLSLSYNNTGISGDGSYDDFDPSLNGVGLEYTYGLPLSSSSPVFLELGAKAQFMLGTYEEQNYEEKYKFLTLMVPLNLTYSFQINDRFSLAPYAGVNFKVHALGEMKAEEGEYSETSNVFDKDDMGKDGTYNRFQMGWQVGVGARINRYYLGLSYGTDFT